MTSKSWFGIFLSVSFALALFIRPCHATITNTFMWGWAESLLAPAVLNECQLLKIQLIPVIPSTPTVLGTPPYYFMAFEPGGLSTITFAGTDPYNLTWQVKYAAGTKLALSMLDADGNSGGIPNNTYSVVKGQDTSCLPSTPSSSLVITANVTKDLSTCEPWGLRVAGGTPPYNLTIAALGSPIVTNITLPSGSDVLTYINRANPNSQLLAVVSDSTGQSWRTTSFVNTIGSTNVSCIGLNTEPGNSSEIPFYSDLGSSKSKRKTIIVAVCATTGTLLVIGAALFGYVVHMRRKATAVCQIRDGQDLVPRAFQPLDTIESHRSMVYSPLRPIYSEHKVNPPTLAGTSTPETLQPTSYSGNMIPSPGIGLNSSYQTDPFSPHSTQSSNTGGAAPSNQSFTAGAQPDIIIQHRDREVMQVQELPPPYLDLLQLTAAVRQR